MSHENKKTRTTQRDVPNGSQNSPAGVGSPTPAASAAPGKSAANLQSDPYTTVTRRVIRINGRFFLILMLLFVALGAGTYALHSVQMERNSKSLKKLSEEAETSGQLQKAIAYLQQYLRFQPKDYDEKIHLADLVERLSRAPRSRQYVFRLLEDVLRNDAERADADEVRLRVVNLAVEIRRYRAGLDHVKVLRDKSPNDHKLTVLEGVCRQGLGDYRKAVYVYLQAIRQAEQLPADSTENSIEPYVLLAAVLTFRPEAMPYREDVDKTEFNQELRKLFPPRGQKDPQPVVALKPGQKPRQTVSPGSSAAEFVVFNVYQRLTERGRPQHLAHLADATFLLSRQRFQAAKWAIDRAREITKDNPDVLLAASSYAMTMATELSLKEGTQEEQRNYLTQAHQIAGDAAALANIPEPKRLQFLLQLASIEQQRAGFANLSTKQRLAHITAANKHLEACDEKLAAFRQSSEGKKRENEAPLRQLEISLLSQQIDVLLRKADENGVALDEKSLKEKYARLQSLGSPPVQLGLISAKWLLANRKWREAIARLSTMRRSAGSSKRLRRKIDLSLAECYHELRDSVGRIQVLKQGLSTDPHWTEGRVLLAAALAASGQLEEAIREFDQSGRALAAVQLRLRTIARQPADRRARVLPRVGQVLSQVESKLSDPGSLRDVSLTLLKAQLISLDPARTKTRDAEIQSLLDAAIDRHTKASKKQNETYRQRRLRLERLLNARAQFEAGRSGGDKSQNLAAALKRLESYRKDYPDSPLLLTNKVRLAIRLPEPQAAKQLNDLFAEISSSPSGNGRSRIRKNSGGKHHDGRILTNSATVAVLESIARGLAAIHDAKHDHLKNCRIVWNKVKELAPNDLGVHLESARLAIRQNDRDALKSDLEAIDRIEQRNAGQGFVGAWGNYFRAADLVATAVRKGRKARDAFAKLPADQRKQLAASVRADFKTVEKNLEDARELLTQAVNEYSLWPQLHRQLGRVEELLGDRDTAYRHYDRAFELGDRSVVTCEFILRYLNRKRDFKAAYERLKTIKQDAGQILLAGDIDFSSKTPSITQLAVGLEARMGELAAARGFLRETGQNYQREVLRARLYFREYQNLSEREKKGRKGQDLLRQAENQMRTATEEAPDSPEPWIAWVAQLAVLKRTSEAEQRIAAALAKLPEKVKFTTAADCYVLLDNLKKAEEYFLKSEKVQPDDVALQLRIVRFYAATRQLAKSLPHLKVVLESKTATSTQKAVARHFHILAVASSGKYDDFVSALHMLEKPETASKADLFTRVGLLSGSPLKRHREDLIATLEELDRRFKALRDGDRFQLARLYQKTGDWKQARKLVEDLLAKRPDDPGLLGWYAVELLQNESKSPELLRLVNRKVNRLEAVNPKSLSTAITRATYLLAKDPVKGSKTAAEMVLNADFSRAGMKPNTADAAKLLLAAQFCEHNKMLKATKTLRERYEKVSGKPEAVLARATFYARQGRHAEALEIVRSAAKTCKPVTLAVAAANIVSVGKPSVADIATAKSIVETALRAEPKSLQIRWQKAAVLTASGTPNELKDAEAIYRQLLKETKNNVAVMNNLAWLLAMREEKLPEALALIDLVIKEKGPIGEFLDTRGIIHLRMEQPAKAVADLQAAVEETADPEKFLHLAQALLKLGNRPAAIEAMQQAKKHGLSFQRLHRLEHRRCQDALNATGITLDD